MQGNENLKGLPIGIDDFKDLINSNGYYVDKTLFIKEIIDDISKVKFIARPRRFGKTLNLSMLRYFFEKTDEDTSYLFKDLKIYQQGDRYTSQQGQYPVIFLSFKDLKEINFDNCFKNLKMQVAEEYKRHDYILSQNIRESDKRLFNEIMNGEADQVTLKNSLKFLTRILNEYHDKDVVVLIDEYDTPINQGYLCEYYDSIIDFMRSFLGAGLKGNTALKMGIITGVHRFAKESIFSDFNNIEVNTIVHNIFADKFGFTEEEVEVMLKYYHIGYTEEEVKEWYNGYIFGKDTVIYNPWSMLNYIKQGVLQPYWVNTSDNGIIRDIIGRTDADVKRKMHMLIEGKELTDITINTNTNFRDIRNREVISEDILWTLLLVSGYLKPVDKKLERGRTKYSLKIPNIEILLLYEDIVKEWFQTGGVATDKLKKILLSLVEGDIEEFSKEFEYLVRKTFSYFDVGEKTAENFYHAFILGMLVNLEGKYRIISNRESGKGRPDVIIIPKDTSKKGVVMEFKVCDSEDDDKMKQKALDALEKVKSMNYRDEIVESGISEIVEVVVVFCGKKVHVEWR